MARLEMNLLGAPEILLDGVNVKFDRRGSTLLLTYLALSGRMQSRDSLATVLMGEVTEDSARRFLSNVLADLRRHVGDYIVSVGDRLGFNTSLVHSVDVHRFRALLAGESDEISVERLLDALALYHGELLKGIRVDDSPELEAWLRAERDELSDLYTRALRAQINWSASQRAWASGIENARRLVATAPWDEDGHRQLMRMLASSGQRTAAIAQYHVCRRVLRDELDIEPEPETVALFERLAAAETPPPSNVPAPGDHFIGRAAELQMLSAALADPDCRLISIVGLGGSGKTRLALEVARMFAQACPSLPEQPFQDGVYFVPLGDHDADTGRVDLPAAAAQSHLLGAIGTALDVPPPPGGGDPARHILAQLQRRRLLLIVDDVEQFTAGVSVLSELLLKAPGVKLLVTSRRPLQLRCERVLRLDGLRLPRDADEVEEAEASALFLQEARRGQLGYTLRDAEREHLVRICELLGGFPLGLILAARWATVLACSTIALQLSAGLHLLATDETDLPRRHRNMRTSVENALQRLSTEQQALAEALAVDAADHETWPLDKASGPTLPQIRQLNDQALVRIDTTQGVVRMHPLVVRYFSRASSAAAASLHAA
jgi:DNA-binding SARP family transcriptional activator